MFGLLKSSKTISQHSAKERNNRRVSSVDHSSLLKRSSYSISSRFLPRASEVRCTFSNARTSLTKNGLQTGAAYSGTGRTRDLYNVENALVFDEPTALKNKPNNLLASLTVTSTCSLHTAYPFHKIETSFLSGRMLIPLFSLSPVSIQATEN